MKKMNDVGRLVLKQLFKAMGITRVVYVDDRYGITRERITELCRDMNPEQIVASAAFKNLSVGEEEEVFQTRLEAAIKKTKRPDWSKIYEALEKTSGGPEGERDRQASLAIRSLMQGVAEFVELSHSDWVSKRDQLLSELPTTPTFFIFDEDFRLEGLHEHTGRQLIEEVHARITKYDYAYAYALLTHNASDDSQEREIERSIAEQQETLKDYVVVIAKARLEDPKRFTHRLKSTLLFRLFRTMVKKLRGATEEAHTQALKEIENLTVDSFERIVLGSSKVEGAWPPETLVRIFGVLHEGAVRKKLRSDEEFHSVVSGIEPICGIDPGEVYPDVALAARRLQKLEYYEDGDEINSLHLPIELGDIFEDHDGNRFVLLAQPCDLVVRAKGWRRSESRDKRQVVPLLAIKEMAEVARHTPDQIATRSPGFQSGQHLEHTPAPVQADAISGSIAPSLGHQSRGTSPCNCELHQHELKYCSNDESRVFFASLNEVRHLPLWVLDLSVMNADGRCAIGSTQSRPAILSSPWKSRFDHLKRLANEVLRFLDSLPALPNNRHEEMLHALLRFPLGTDFRFTVEPPDRKGGDGWKLVLGVRRVARLRERHAAELLSHYGMFVSRDAHPHDLTRFE